MISFTASSTRLLKIFREQYELWLDMTKSIFFVELCLFIPLDFSAFSDEYKLYRQYTGQFQKSGMYTFFINVIFNII